MASCSLHRLVLHANIPPMIPITNQPPPIPGIDRLCGEHADWIAGKRCALLSHAAATSVTGATSAQLLAATPGVQLDRILSPEHGYFGNAGAGETCPSLTDPALGIPIHSLYGEDRKPTESMLEGVDCLIIDLQDIGLRCYTYVSTLALALEAADALALPVIVTDRPIPFDRAPTGPMLDPKLRSFVGQIDAPFLYAMTPAETARWLQAEKTPTLDLRTVACQLGNRSLGQAYFDRTPAPPPSPALTSRESMLCYPAMVFLEAFDHISHGRGTPLPFQVCSADWIDGMALTKALNAIALPGTCFFPHLTSHKTTQSPICGVRLHIADPIQFNPMATAFHILRALHQFNPEQLWHTPEARPKFLDKLAGTPLLREAVQSDMDLLTATAQWEQGIEPFKQARANALIYPREPHS